jgi:hypothetical protein
VAPSPASLLPPPPPPPPPPGPAMRPRCIRHVAISICFSLGDGPIRSGRNDLVAGSRTVARCNGAVSRPLPRSFFSLAYTRIRSTYRIVVTARQGGLTHRLTY